MGKLFVDLRDSNQEYIYHFLSNNAKVCIVDFYADWCGPCIKLGKELESNLLNQKKICENLYICENDDFDLSDESIKNKVVFIKINVDEFSNLAGEFKIRSIPHVVFFKEGKIQPEITRNCAEIFNIVNKLL